MSGIRLSENETQGLRDVLARTTRRAEDGAGNQYDWGWVECVVCSNMSSGQRNLAHYASCPVLALERRCAAALRRKGK